MRHKITGKQPNSRMCFICGLENQMGLKAEFFEVENGEVVAIVHPSDEHQGYPGNMHGGIISGLLDETIGRAIMPKYQDTMWGVTVELNARFRKPVPLEVELRVVGRVIKENTRFFEGSGELLLPDGTVAATGKGRFMKLPLEKITDAEDLAEGTDWKVVSAEADPKEVNY